MAPSVNAVQDEKNPGAPREPCSLLSCSTPDFPLLGGSPMPFSRSLVKSSVVEAAPVPEGASDADGVDATDATDVVEVASDADGADATDAVNGVELADVGPATAEGTTTARLSARTNPAMLLIKSPPSGPVSVVVWRVPARGFHPVLGIGFIPAPGDLAGTKTAIGL